MSKNEPKNERLSRGFEEITPYEVPGYDCSIRLDGNESPFPIDPGLREKIFEALKTVEINRYPDPGANSLRESISKNTGAPPESILLGNGSDELIQILIQTFTGKSGKVLVPRPTFSMYRISSLVLNKKVIEVDLNESFDLDLDEILKKIDENDPDLLFFATPNNPTGNAFDPEKITEILKSTSAVVAVDEAYFDYHGYTFIHRLKEYNNLVVMRTLSKIGFASIRLGMLFASPTIVGELNKARLPYNINAITQSVAEVVMNSSELLKKNYSEIIKEREILTGELKKLPGIDVYPSDANFILIKVPDADHYFERLVESDILVRNFTNAPGLSGCLRVTVGTEAENASFLRAVLDISLP